MQGKLFQSNEDERSAVVSSCAKYRYALLRKWDGGAPRVLFIGLNPSTADHSTDDATSRVCRNYAQRWGFGSMSMANLFCYRSTDPAGLSLAQDPVGPDADIWIKRLLKDADQVICCWTSLGRRFNRDAAVLSLIKDPFCLIQLSDGSPGHPLYKSRNLIPVPFDPLKLVASS